jgi:capsular exopolysaccharide synthesis family protein
MHTLAKRGTNTRSQDDAYQATQATAAIGQVDLRAIVKFLRRRKWTILLTVICVIGIAILITSQIAQRFTATALVVVDSRDSQLLGFQSGITESTGVNSIVSTEVEIAGSTRVLSRAAEGLDLANAPEYAESPTLLELVNSLLGLGNVDRSSSGARTAFADLSATERARIVEQFSKSVDISRRGLTNIIAVSATALSPQAAADTANAVATAYIEEQIEAKLGSTERAASFLRDRVERLAREVIDKETKTEQFVSTSLAELGSPAAKAYLAKIGDEAKKQRLTGSRIAEIRNAIEKDDYARLAELSSDQQTDFAARRQAFVDQLSGTGSANQIGDARLALEALDKEIKAAAEKRLREMQDDISSSNARSTEFRHQLDVALFDLELPKEVSSRLFQLQREAETSRTLYSSFLSKLRQVEQQTDFNIPDSRIIASAEVPAKPSFPPVTLILAGATLFSVFAGVGLAFLRENYVGGINNVEQLENVTGIPVVSAVPRYVPSDQSSANIAVIDQPLSEFSEAIRKIRLATEAYGSADKRCLFVTSALPGDGKTTVAVALARQAAMSGIRTLLIDADLRHPSVHSVLGEKVDEGLLEFLAKRDSASSENVQIVRESETNVDYVLCKEGSAVATDALLMSKGFTELVNFGRAAYDLVIIDTPPVGLVVDATIVARHCDLGIFVVRYSSTHQHDIRASLRELRGPDVPLVAVLNLIPKAESYGYGDRRKYRDFYLSNSANRRRK